MPRAPNAGVRSDTVRREEKLSDATPRSRTGDRKLSRGTHQVGVRLYNERLVLSIIRRRGSVAKAEIARATGLSPQTISIITNQLTRDGLLVRGTPTRGRVGQPLVPYSLNPEGALALGLKIGRRSVELVLIDLVGAVRARLHQPYDTAEPQFILDFLLAGIDRLTTSLSDEQRDRIAGVGIASPFEMWNWQQETGATPEIVERWRKTDIKAEAERDLPWPVYFYNDATSACAAELMLGNPHHFMDFLHVFVGTFIGGGVVLNGSLYPGRSGYAGALGPLPMPVMNGSGAPYFQQMIRQVSILSLAERIAASGADPHVLWQNRDDWSGVGSVLDDWIDDIAAGLALTIVSATSVIDFEAIVIDGGFPPTVRDAVVARTIAAMDRFDRQGLVPAEIVAGTIGPSAPAIGGACLPLLASFAQDREVLFKEAPLADTARA